MARQKIERIKTLPSDQAERDRLKKTVKEAVDIMLQISALKEQLKDIYTVEKEDHNYDPKFLKVLTGTEFDEQYNAQKKRLAIEEASEALAELDILMGR